MPTQIGTNAQVFNKVSHSSWRGFCSFSILHIQNKIVIFLVAVNLSSIIWQEKVTEISCSIAMFLSCQLRGLAHIY